MVNEISRTRDILERLFRFTKYLPDDKRPKKAFPSTLRVEKKKKRKRRFKTAD